MPLRIHLLRIQLGYFIQCECRRILWQASRLQHGRNSLHLSWQQSPSHTRLFHCLHNSHSVKPAAKTRSPTLTLGDGHITGITHANTKISNLRRQLASDPSPSSRKPWHWRRTGGQMRTHWCPHMGSLPRWTLRQTVLPPAMHLFHHRIQADCLLAAQRTIPELCAETAWMVSSCSRNPDSSCGDF